jgi:uncharacterized protein (DUF4415 family)
MRVREPAIKSDLARIDRLRDEEIDYSDIPELGDDVFAQPLVPWPPNKETITIRVDADVLDWFKGHGPGYQTRINLVLRRYMDVASSEGRRKRVERRATAAQRRSSKRTRRS